MLMRPEGVTVITGSGQELNLYATREVLVPQTSGRFRVPKSKYVVVLIRLASEAAEITLNSVNPLQQPNIVLSYVTNDHDIIALRDGIMSAYNVLENAEKDIIEDEYP